ncbi:MAG: glycoside hydrolase family 3 C-terminal domain-containing protein, partial [Clostridiales bacterium]|nr:glycoside hydrolase family 3 C-terminal domain-containing protein [Clostridiales bacterium]
APARDVSVSGRGRASGLPSTDGDQGNQFASGDKPNLNLPGRQEALLRLAVESGKPVVLVLLSGSALAINYAAEHVPAILQGWYPGAQGGAAIARILFGEVSPEGKLPITFYHSAEELPSFTDYSMQGRTYRYMAQEALYHFGYGLSFTRFRLRHALTRGIKVTKDG